MEVRVQEQARAVQRFARLTFELEEDEEGEFVLFFGRIADLAEETERIVGFWGSEIRTRPDRRKSRRSLNA